ncbi:MAG: hypothetical protein Q9168_001412 [Polycauliona sp. 1 TL-2023]
MLSRGNSEASARLRRAKSSASIKTRRSLPNEPDVVDPFVAKEQALAAAFHAYGRANASEMPSRASLDAASQHHQIHAVRPLTRSKSIRFAGPAAQPGQGVPITVRVNPPPRLEHETRRRSLHPRLRRQDSSIQADDAFMAALPSHGDYVETRVASQPSSYRRLRKSKSMFSPGLWSNAIAPSASRNNTQHASDLTGPQPGSRLGRSLSILRPSMEHSQSQATVSDAAQVEAVGLARDQYFRHLEQQRLDGQPSHGNALSRRRSQKAFRRSVRTSSANSYGSAVESALSSTGLHTEHRGIGGRARDLSSTFKHKFKRVFNRSSGEGGTFPAQQLQATRPHFGDSATLYTSFNTQVPTAESFHNPGLEVPILAKEGSLYVGRQRSSRAGSVHTIGGEQNDDTTQSRVTSWTNSSAANTVSSQRGPGMNRLSIIQETGGVLPQHQSLPQSETTGSQTQKRKTSLYAKLQQRMARSNSGRPSDSPPEVAGGASNLFPTGPEIVPSSRGHLSELRGRLAVDPYRSNSLPSITSNDTSSANVQHHENKTKVVKSLQTNTPQASAKEPSPKRPLRESKSTFFPHSSHIGRSRTSPFRQAMQSSGHTDRKYGPDLASNPLERFGKDSSLSAIDRIRDRSLTRSESIYSRTSSGDTPQPLDSSSSLAQAETGWERYLATIPPRINLEDRIPSSAVETKTARELGHKKEHAETSGVDTDLGRLHVSTPMLKDSSTSPRIGVDIRPLPRQSSSQPMIDRFPLMSISPRPSSKNIQHKPLDSPRKVTANMRENENRPLANRPEKDTGNSASHLLESAVSASQKSTKDALRRHNVARSDRIEGLHGTPLRANPLPTSTPSPHNRSSPERIARLRRMQSNHTLGTTNPRKNIGIPFIHRQPMPEPGSSGNQDSKRDGPVHISPLHRDAIDPDSGGSKMVDLFLSNRMDSSSDDIVFI